MTHPSEVPAATAPPSEMSFAEEKLFFNTFGFLICPRLLSQDEISGLRREAERLLRDDWGTVHDGQERQQIQGFVEQSEALVDFIRDPRILRRVQRLVGQKLIWVGSDGNRYVGATGWHPDGSNMNVRRVKVLFYLDHLLRDSGALRVVPGSHKPEFHQKLRTLLQRRNRDITPYGVRASRRHRINSSGFGVSADRVPSYPIETRPGDIVFFDQNIWHSSFGGYSGRAMFTMNFAKEPATEHDWEFIIRMYRGQLNHVRRRQKTRHPFLYGDFLPRHSDPELRSIIKPLLDRGCR